MSWNKTFNNKNLIDFPNHVSVSLHEVLDGTAIAREPNGYLTICRSHQFLGKGET